LACSISVHAKLLTLGKKLNYSTEMESLGFRF